MQPFMKILRIILIVLLFLLALTAIPGGIMLMVNFFTPPVQTLAGSIFKDFTVPGLALAIIVGGSALLAAILLLRKSKYGLLFAAAAGIIIMFFEFVEVMIIGAPTGPSLVMQVFYFGLGTVLEIISMGMWFLQLRNAD
jgi:hypothetical protein